MADWMLRASNGSRARVMDNSGHSSIDSVFGKGNFGAGKSGSSSQVDRFSVCKSKSWGRLKFLQAWETMIIVWKL